MKTLLYSGQVELDFDERKHAYRVTDGGETFDVPGVTQVLGIIDKSGPLTQWAANSTIEALRGLIEPDKPHTKEQLETAYQSARFNFRKVKQKACDVGTTVHAWIEAYIKSVYEKAPEPELPSDEAAMKSCWAASEWLRTHDFTPLATEQRIYSRKYKYAGTMDFPALVDGRLAVIDWKTSKAIYPEYAIQLAAYAQAYTEMGGALVSDLYLVRIGKDDGEFEARRYDADSQPTHLAAFLAAKELYLSLQAMKLAEKSKAA